MAFEFVPISREVRGKRFISIDKYGRFTLSSSTRKMIGIDGAFSSWIAVAYDKETKCIAIQKEELAKNAPADAKAKVDRRGYFKANMLIDRANIDLKKTPYRFYYNGEVSVKGERRYSFKLAEDTAD